MGIEIDQTSSQVGNRKKILFVDDLPNESVVDRFKYLHEDKVSIKVATGLASAIAYIDKTSFDVIICDGNLTDGDTGLDLYKYIENKFIGIFIMYTADESILAQAKKLGLITVDKIRPLTLFDLLKEMKIL